ncbi:MAG: protein phosphatase 2C domain-containing protein [Coleofasciculus sp. Co-bin14]|nr:protein phosphatase 2C domain-containing protein [Coleofasciculus sp. Co-bin14]
MENPAATLHCPNTRCQAPNPQSNKFCKKCRTPLLRRYLWAIGQGIEAYKPGEFLAGRYLLVSQRVLLDTKPAIPPETPQEIPKGITPYLKLSPYGLQIPQVYGWLAPVQGSNRSEVWLLEEAPISKETPFGEVQDADSQGQLLPKLTSAWKNASGMRQLNWLWQLANLWQPLLSEGVASSLLTPALLRVEGSIIRVLELQADTNPVPTLQDLGQLWSQLLPEASPVIAAFFEKLCTQMREGQLRTSEELVAQLDRGLKDCGRSQSRAYQIFTCTDQGPSRNHNEDACYPPGGQLIRPSGEASALAIVCDGIGGHEGGEVASRLAIDTLRDRVGKLSNVPDSWNSTTLSQELDNAVCAANDLISQQNDSEHRSDRQRMGTTLVMGRTCGHEMYVTHVGDSRVYWITRHNCYQVTQDDDLASREVRLGYALYRNAIQNPTAGSLVQALGMAPSVALHPTVQRFVLDEDCIFLLCSDGLSDNDRVEQYWQTEILPILDGQIDLRTVGTRLIEIANTQNGHDNATIALVYCKVTPSKETRQTQLSVSQLELPRPSVSSIAPTTVVSAAPSQMKTQQIPTARSARRPWGLLLGIFVLLGLGGVLAYFLIPGVSNFFDPWIKQVAFNSSSEPTSVPASSSSPAGQTASPTEISSLEEGKLIQVVNSSPKNANGKPIRLVLRRGLPPQDNELLGVIPTGSVLQVIDEQVINEALELPQVSWLQVKVCSPGTADSQAQKPTPATPSPGRPQNQVASSPVVPKPQPTSKSNSLVEQGVVGWIRKGDIEPNIDPNFTPTSAPQSGCGTPTPSPASASPTPSPASPAPATPTSFP